MGGALLLACVAFVVFVRMLPLSLAGVDDWAEGAVRQAHAARIAKQVGRHRPAEERRQEIIRGTDEWITHNKAKFEAEQAALAERAKSRLRYTGADGREHVYLGDMDSYVWLRHARNYLRSGTTCDSVQESECRDTYTNAPVGSEMRYGHSLHIVTIVAIHRLLSFFEPGYPLPASAFWVPVVIGALGVFPAFFIGCRLADNIGGVIAALLCSLYQHFLNRSIGGDNDVWNVVLPLFMVWAAMLAADAGTPRRQTAYALLAALFCGLSAATWRGWPFTYFVVLAGLLGAALLYALQYAFDRNGRRMGRAQAVFRVAVVFYAGAGLFTTLGGSEESYFSLPAKAFGSFVGIVRSTSPDVVAGRTDVWPNLFSTVTELLPPNLTIAADSLGGASLFYLSLVGLLVLLLPRRTWQISHWSVLLTGAALFAFLLNANDLGRGPTVVLLVLPFLGALLLFLAEILDEDADGPDLGPGLIIVVWLIAAVYLCYSGIRFLQLLSPPFAFGCAVLAGRLYQVFQSRSRRLRRHGRVVADAVVFVLLLTPLKQPIEDAYHTANDYVPAMRDAWWGTLEKIRDQSQPGAIINLWWDYGHWAKFVADRPVVNDGSSLLTHIPYWLGKAFAAVDARESIGVLRMLNCGSDALPTADGKHGAYAKLLAVFDNPIEARSLLMELVKLDRDSAGRLLARRGVIASQRADILAATHCTPPEAYLIITSGQASKSHAWLHLAHWDFSKAYLAKMGRFLPKQVVVADLVDRFGYTEAEADKSYAQVQALTDQQALDDFISPLQGFLSPQWFPCHPGETATSMVCPVGIRVMEGQSLFETFTYDPAKREFGAIRLRHGNSERPDGLSAVGTPSVIVRGDGESAETIASPSPDFPDVGVLLDVQNRKIRVGTPTLVQSMLVRLLYLDQYETSYFEKFDDRVAIGGERIVTWKIHWDAL